MYQSQQFQKSDDHLNQLTAKKKSCKSLQLFWRLPSIVHPVVKKQFIGHNKLFYEFTNFVFMCLFTKLFSFTSYSKWRIDHGLSGQRFMEEHLKFISPVKFYQYLPGFLVSNFSKDICYFLRWAKCHTKYIIIDNNDMQFLYSVLSSNELKALYIFTLDCHIYIRLSFIYPIHC